MLKKAVSNSRRLAELSSDTARLIYTWLIPHLDIEGRFSAEPSIIKGNIFPRIKTITEAIISRTLKEMSDIGLIILYQVDGDYYLELRKFKNHQSLRKDKEAQSKIPPPPTGELREDSGTTPVELPTKLREEKRSKEKLREEKVSSGSTPVQSLVDLFNSTTHYLPKVSQINKSRVAKIKTRFKEGKDLDWWQIVFEKADMILIPGKDGKKDWFPNFDWLVENDKNSVKVFEGNYDDAKRHSAGKSFDAGNLWLRKEEARDEEERQKKIPYGNNQDESKPPRDES